MRLSLALIPLACALACTLDNPAFLTVTDPSASSSGAASTGAVSTTDGGGGSTDPTQPGTTASSDPTTGPGTSAGSGTSGTSTTGNNSGGSTSLPETSTTDPVSTSEPAGSTGVGFDMGGPMMCAIEEAGHMPAPFMRPVNALNPVEPISGATCSQWAGKELKGRLYVYGQLEGFSVKADQAGCGSLVNQPSFKFPMEWMLDKTLVGGDSSCVTFKFEAHPQYVDHCAIASIVVFKGVTPIIAGRFGTADFILPIPNIVIGAVPKGQCACAGCCPEAPDPDAYALKVGANEVPQGSPPVEILPVNGKHYFVNFRSDVHPECPQNPDKPDWLHFDWLVARAGG